MSWRRKEPGRQHHGIGMDILYLEILRFQPQEDSYDI